jgi:ABC-type transporter MlaC component
MKQTIGTLLTALIFVTVNAAAQPAEQPNGSSALPPKAVVQHAIETTLAAVRNDPASRNGDLEKINAIVAQKFIPYTDFRLTTQLATLPPQTGGVNENASHYCGSKEQLSSGKAWSTATPHQQEQLFSQFQMLLTRLYATQLQQISSQNVKFTFPGDAVLQGSSPHKSAVVKTHVMNDGDVMDIDYCLTQTANGWKIYDINMMGSWLIQLYRQQFAGQLSQGGIDALLKFLTEHNAPLAG